MRVARSRWLRWRRPRHGRTSSMACAKPSRPASRISSRTTSRAPLAGIRRAEPERRAIRPINRQRRRATGIRRLRLRRQPSKPPPPNRPPPNRSLANRPLANPPLADPRPANNAAAGAPGATLRRWRLTRVLLYSKLIDGSRHWHRAAQSAVVLTDRARRVGIEAASYCGQLIIAGCDHW